MNNQDCYYPKQLLTKDPFQCEIFLSFSIYLTSIWRGIFQTKRMYVIKFFFVIKMLINEQGTFLMGTQSSKSNKCDAPWTSNNRSLG